jgi:superfamily II DNA or RNA helicase
LIFDECHHLPADFFRKVAEDSIAPYRLGLTATPDRADGSHEDLDRLIGPVIYRKKPEDLSGKALAEHETVQIRVKLSDRERQRYQEAIALRNAFLQRNRLNLSGLDGWQNFVMISARSSEGRRAMLAHREAKEISSGTEGKLRVLAELICEHYPEPILIFTNDNATVYRVSRDFLIPAITHQTPVKERHEILTRFRTGEYKTLVASHVLNEGVDVPEARIAIILSGTGSAREYIQRLGRILRKGKAENKLAILYEVIAENTSEEKTSERRRGKDKKTTTYQTGDRQLELLPSPEKRPRNLPRVAESSGEWKVDGEEGDRD